MAFVFAGIGIATLFDLSSLLLCMAMGAVVANFSPDVTQIMDICDGVTPPIFLLFFVASGADLKLSVLPTVGLIGVIYIVPGLWAFRKPASTRRWPGRASARPSALRLAASCASVTRT